MAVAVFMLSLAARAATVTGFSDLVTRLQVSVAADHEIKFVTPTGVQATADTITVTLEADYDLTSISFEDIDLAVDNDVAPGDCSGAFGDSKSLAAVADATNWGAAVSGQTLTLTPKTSAAVGEVPVNSCVRILIGKNATGGAVNDQIINPTVAAQYSITLAGAFGDTGSIAIPIVAGDQVSITASVEGTGGGGGPIGCPPNCPAPTILNVQANNVTETEATIVWNTDTASSSTVNYGTTVAYGSNQSVAGSVFNHSVQLTGLTPGTLYHYRVRSTGTGAESISGDYTFTTTDTTAPVISNVQATNITGTGARIVWDTNEDADSKVDYGIVSGPPYGSNVTSVLMTNAHSLTLAGLAPNTTYLYRVTSKDAFNNISTTAEFNFKTLDTVAPVISNISVDAIAQTSARINWATDELANGTVRYGLGIAYGSTADNPALVANHQLVIAGLAPGTLYHFSVSSHDAAGNGATSTDQTFTTLADTTPPSNISDFAIVASNQQNSLSWTNPVDVDFAGVVIRRSAVDYPATPVAGDAVYNSNGNSMVDVGLTNGVRYYYTAFSYDGSGNFAAGALANGRPFDAVAPGPVTNFVVTAGNASNALSWTNPIVADFADVRVQSSTAGFPPTPLAGTDVYLGSGQAHAHNGLNNGVTYYYSVFARDTSGNYSVAAQASGTPQGQPPAAPVCGNAICEVPENNASCPADCPIAPPPPAGPVCGNAICEAPENNASCPADCPAPPVAPPITPPGQSASTPIDTDSVEVYALNRRLRLHYDSAGFYHALPNRSLSIIIPVTALKAPVSAMTLNFGTGSYLFSRPGLTDTNGRWTTDVSTPSAPGVITGTVIIKYEDGTSDVVPFEVMVEKGGVITAKIDGRDMPVEGAVITIYRRINPWIVWDATPYLQANPITTAADGSFTFMAPQGEYYISVSKEGYRTYDGAPFNLTTEVVNPQVELIRVPDTMLDVIVPGATIVENIGNVAGAIGAQGAYIVKILQNEIVQDPRVENATTNYVVPAAAAVTTAVIVTTVQATSILGYFYLLITQPLLLLGRRKRKEYGVVFNSLTKLPVDLAIVRLFRSDGKLVRTSATDKLGRYAFLVDPGEYRIEATRPGYSFPSQYLKDRKEDAQYLDLYHGENVAAGEKGAVITANIPLDPLEVVATPLRMYMTSVLRKLQSVAAFAGAALTLVAALLYRLPYLWILAGVQLVIFLLFRRLARPTRPKNWGIIYDAKTKKPIPFAVARIVETEYNKVLESRMTDARGRYNFLVGNNKYVVSIEKAGYEPVKTEIIDLSTRNKGEGVVDLDIPMRQKDPEKPQS